MMLGIASYAFADVINHDDYEDITMSSFETAAPGGMDGWVMNGTNTSTPGVYTTGVTDGFKSLKLDTVNSWWNEVMYIDMGAIEGGKDVVLGNNTLSIDFAWLASDNTGPGQGWNQNPLIKLLVNPDLGWDGNWWASGDLGIDTGYYDYGVGQYQGVDGSATLSWNYQDISAGHINSNSTSYKFILEIVKVTADVSALYLDNVRFSGDAYSEITPEPATMALLGLGSLALLRRKK